MAPEKPSSWAVYVSVSFLATGFFWATFWVKSTGFPALGIKIVKQLRLVDSCRIGSSNVIHIAPVGALLQFDGVLSEDC